METGVLAGVVSWGEGCARADYSGVNAEISAVIDWIESTICQESAVPPVTCPSKTPPMSSAIELDNAVTTTSNPELTEEPFYNPRDSNAESQVDTNSYPGNGPSVASHAITINVLYGSSNAQNVNWVFSQADGNNGWMELVRSGRGMPDSLISETLPQLTPGSYWFQVITAPDAIVWMSIMAPRGEQVYGKESDFTQSQYDVYLEINENGVACLNQC